MTIIWLLFDFLYRHLRNVSDSVFDSAFRTPVEFYMSRVCHSGYLMKRHSLGVLTNPKYEDTPNEFELVSCRYFSPSGIEEDTRYFCVCVDCVILE